MPEPNNSAHDPLEQNIKEYRIPKGPFENPFELIGWEYI
jgi:hypothetical protein